MKALLILGLLASIAAAGIQFMVRDSLKSTRLEKDRLNREALGIHADIEKVNVTLAELNGQITSTNSTAKNEKLQVTTLNADITQKTDEIESLRKQVAEIEQKKAQMNADIARILPEGSTPDQVMAEVESLKTENDTKAKEAEALTKELEVARREASKGTDQLKRLEAGQSARNRAIQLASRTGTVSVVNPEYGFAVVSMGRNQGVTEETKLLVRRGAQFVGRLSIVRIEDSRTFADISEGAQVMPGDEVIFESSGTPRS